MGDWQVLSIAILKSVIELVDFASLMWEINTSMQKINKKNESGSPCHIPSVSLRFFFLEGLAKNTSRYAATCFQQRQQ